MSAHCGSRCHADARRTTPAPRSVRRRWRRRPGSFRSARRRARSAPTTRTRRSSRAAVLAARSGSVTVAALERAALGDDYVARCLGGAVDPPAARRPRPLRERRAPPRPRSVGGAAAALTRRRRASRASSRAPRTAAERVPHDAGRAQSGQLPHPQVADGIPPFGRVGHRPQASPPPQRLAPYR